MKTRFWEREKQRKCKDEAGTEDFYLFDFISFFSLKVEMLQSEILKTLKMDRKKERKKSMKRWEKGEEKSSKQ